MKHVLGTLLVMMALVGVGQLALRLPARATQNDFAHYYLSSRLLAQGQSPYGVDLAPLYAAHGFAFEAHIPRATNPLLLLWLCVPLTRLAPAAAFWAWTAVQALSLLAVLWWLARLLPARLSGQAWGLLVALTLSSLPLYYHFYFGQVQLLLAALVLSAYGLQRRGRHHSAVAVAVLAGLLKLFPLVLVPWFVWRASDRWAGRARYALEAGFLIAVLIAATGPTLWLDFARHGLPVVQANVITQNLNYSLAAFVTNTAVVLLGVAPPQALNLGAGAGLVAIGLTYGWLAWRRPAPEVAFATMLIAMLLSSTTAWVHYLVFLLWPLALAGVRVTGTGRVLYGLLVGIFMTAGLDVLLWGRYVWVNLGLSYLPLYAMLALLALLVHAPDHRTPALGECRAAA